MSGKAAPYAKLAGLHSRFTDYLIHILDEAMATPKVNEDGQIEHLSIPLDAATMGCISRYLKDNEITCEPAEQEGLDELREKYRNEARNRNNSVASILAEAKANEALIN